MEKIAIVTGSTGGLGKVFIQELLKEDIDKIWAVGRNKSKLDELCSTYGDKIYPVQCDLCNEEEVKNIYNLLNEKKPVIMYLVNNAGMAKFGKISKFTDEEISKTININCKTPTLMCQYSIPYMIKGSKILNISSASSFQPNPYIAIYSATKVYLKSYSRSLNYELKDKGITSTAVCPGWVDTDMLKSNIKFPGIVSPERVVKQAIRDAKKGKDMSVCSLFVKYEHVCSKIFPQKMIMRIWGKGVKKYVED